MIVIFYPLCIRERIDELLRECGIVSHDKISFEEIMKLLAAYEDTQGDYASG